MADENLIPAGSVPVNPDNSVPAAVEPAVEPTPVVEPVAPVEGDNATDKTNKMLEANQQMIGKQGNEIGALKAQIATMSEKPAGPSGDEQLASIYAQMDSGEIEIQDGMRQALAINSQQTVDTVMTQVGEQQRQSDITKAQTNFIRNNPTYESVLASGELKPFLDAEPLMDNFTAFHLHKAAQESSAKDADWETKVAAAKEDGAKLAKGAEGAGKVIGKQGAPVNNPQVTKPFANAQEETDAMMKTLKDFRAGQAQ